MLLLSGGITLVDELVEGMLSIGSRLSPDYWPSVVVHTCSVVSNVLSIWLHITLDSKHSQYTVDISFLKMTKTIACTKFYLLRDDSINLTLSFLFKCCTNSLSLLSFVSNFICEALNCGLDHFFNNSDFKKLVSHGAVWRQTCWK